MGWLSITAFFFLMWWTVLFVALPFGLRTQQEDSDVTLGTVASAPRGRHMWKAILRTTAITVVIVGSVVFAVNYLGMSFADLPQIVPSYQ
jgi:predicted secreted protein